MKLFSHRFFALFFTVWLVVLNSSRATADEVLVILCDPPYGYRYVPVLFGRDKLFEISGSSQKELCSDQDSVLTYENSRLICRYATVATKAIMRVDVDAYEDDLDECISYNELDGVSTISLSCLESVTFDDTDFNILRAADASIAQWYRSYVSKIEIDFTLQTASSSHYTIWTEQKKSEEALLSGVLDGTIRSSSLHVSESGYDYRGETCK